MSSSIAAHLDHPLELTTYGRYGVVANTSLECLDCNEVIVDIEADDADVDPALEAVVTAWKRHVGHGPTTDGTTLVCCTTQLPYPQR